MSHAVASPSRRDRLAGTTPGEPHPGQTLSRLWPLFALSWLAFVLIDPVATMLDEAETRGDVLLALGWGLAFSAAYLRITVHHPFQRTATRVERWRQAGLLTVLAALVLHLDLTHPRGYFWVFIGVIVPAGALLPARAAALVVAGLTSLAIGIDAARSGMDTALQVPGIAIWGVATIMLRHLVLTIDELRAAREELARLAVIEERLRFGRDLHDLLGHSLSLIALKSELARRLMPAPGERAAAEIADIEQVARLALRDVRDAVAGYRQPALRDELDGAREALGAAGIDTQIDAGAEALPPAAESVLAWAIREGVTNVLRHSRAGRCRIRIWQGRDTVHAAIEDDGRGPGGASPGSGLDGLAERVAALGGRLATGAGEEGGFSLHVTLPVPAASAAVGLASMPAGAVVP